MGRARQHLVCRLQLVRIEAFKVVALHNAQGLQSVQLQAGLEVVEKGAGSGVELGFLFDEETVHGGVRSGAPGSDRD